MEDIFPKIRERGKKRKKLTVLKTLRKKAVRLTTKAFLGKK